MGHEKTIVDASSPAEIAAAIRRVNSEPGLRIGPGIKALWTIYKAPNHTISRAALEEQYGALDLHFGWFCRRVAELLGANNPDVFALVDYGTDDAGRLMFTLKASVVTAMKA